MPKADSTVGTFHDTPRAVTCHFYIIAVSTSLPFLHHCHFYIIAISTSLPFLRHYHFLHHCHFYIIVAGFAVSGDP
jgi:hypothetical protein